MKQTVRGRKRPGRRSDDKTKYARLLAIPAAIVLVLLIVILVMDKKPGSSKNTEDTTVLTLVHHFISVSGLLL